MKKLIVSLSILLIVLLVGSIGVVAADNIKVGVCMASVQSQAFQAIADAMERKGEELGAEVTILSSEHDLSRQINQVQDLITRGVDSIIINSVDADGIVSVVEQAKSRGINVLAVDRKINTNIDFSIETDNYAAGRAAAQHFALTTLGEEEVKVLLLIADPTATALRERQEGFGDEVNNWRHLNIVDKPSIGTSTERAYNAVLDSLRNDSEIKAIFTSSDLYLPPIWSALTEQEKLLKKGEAGHIMISSVDGDATALEGLREGKNTSVISQLFVEMGLESMNAAVKLAKGDSVDTKMKLLPTITVTKENLDYLGRENLWGYPKN